MEGYIPEPMTIGGVIPVYGLLVLFGFCLSLLWSYVEWTHKGLRKWDYIQVVSFTTIGALYGAKLWYMIFDPINAFANVNDFLDVLIIVFIPATGRSIIGTVVFAPIIIYLVSRYNPDIKFRQTIDILLPSILIGQFVARWGNFVNHQVFGEEWTNIPTWLPTWLVDNMYITLDGETLYRQPLFLYESFTDIIIFIFITLIIKNMKLAKGTAGSSYIMMYGITRMLFELMRNDEYIMHWGPIPTSFIASIILFMVGLYMICKFNWGHNIKKNPSFI